ncbi:hypothetical protein BWGOE2_33230 [Bacillus mycoides]|uniref:Uncharacterized protein n=1 Tax=Bacillus mycoides TaxID=1405 RepID=A0A1E8BLE3_BACMY|nr:hypothetical protein BWGOE2_33230 [Bacillus mycoides]OFD43715.1 hypothetical protein BWGOE1_33090 [Bacillus mycoides]OFD91306.1 hypothetical protein BWGOE11_33080 [Bacillus mycoides]OFD99068.1 hypothetical protein BWGOE13_32770 [Bacillus mycoides]
MYVKGIILFFSFWGLGVPPTFFTEKEIVFIKQKKHYSFCSNIQKGWRFCKSISVSDELQLFAQEIQSFLSPNFLRDLARDVGFVQRTSKYQAKDLVALCVWMNQNATKTSFTRMEYKGVYNLI